MPNHLNMPTTLILGALRTASGQLNSYNRIQIYIELDKKRLSFERDTIYPYLGIHTKFDRFQPTNWSNINIFE